MIHIAALVVFAMHAFTSIGTEHPGLVALAVFLEALGAGAAATFKVLPFLAVTLRDLPPKSFRIASEDGTNSIASANVVTLCVFTVDAVALIAVLARGKAVAVKFQAL
jgi:hypothetical protein